MRHSIPMIINKTTPSVDYSQCLKSLDTQLNDPTKQNLIEVPKVVKPTNKKTCFKNLMD